MTIADATWVATALLHKETPSAEDFAVAEIKEKAKKEGLVEGSRPGLSAHVSQHCVANKPANPATHRMLFKTASGRRRLFRQHEDAQHPDRIRGKVHPKQSDLPPQYQNLIDWYIGTYAASRTPWPPVATPENGVSNKISDSSSVSTLMKLFSKPLFVGPDGDLTIPHGSLSQLGVAAGTPLSLRREDDHLVLQPITEGYIARLLGSFKGDTDLVEARERQHRMER